MKNPYVAVEEQTRSRIALAESWLAKGFCYFAESTFLQAYDAVEKFKRAMDRGSSNPNAVLLTGSNAVNYKGVRCDMIKNDIDFAVRRMERREAKSGKQVNNPACDDYQHPRIRIGDSRLCGLSQFDFNNTRIVPTARR